ncbi:glycosyltransferase family 1 protein [Pseudalkalibacillus caeni]|uniref:Glycosyltransferase family 1 protein n=1 Tax=Exobacillus caeni TaxID=2574798 RepID=A0A5R9F4P0_9BACL|nr:glycosyltransferase family 1 protein [Pseudalkalibacillus caeni]TLS35783.1 glycosyltransferase family 1 protein [Pseudalkalibacillus caeni]
MQPIRILQVVTIMNCGGLETMLMNYYRKIDRTHIQFDFLVHRDEEGHYDKEITELGGRIFRMPPIKPGNYRLYFNKLDKFFEEHTEYKVVHSHINENSSFVLRAAKKHGVPGRIAHSHLSDLGIDLKLPFRLYARYYLRDAPNDYFACSKKAGQWLFGKNSREIEKVKVLNNAVNVEEFKYCEKTRARIRKDLDAKDQLVIGHIGRFNKQKNHDFLIEIFKEIQQKKPDAILVLIGDGNLRKDIEKKVAILGLSSKVRFLGIRNNISELMQGMDLFLFPSLFEGLPVVLVEAQAAGLKCVVSEAITKESDVTGRVEFLSLYQTAKEWAEKVLSSTYEHENTAELLKKHGYDTSSMAYWLTEYYTNYYVSKIN